MESVIAWFRQKMKKPQKPSGTENLLNSMALASIFVATIYVAVDTILRVFFADRFNFIAQLVGKDLYEIYIRIVVLCLFVLLGSHAQYTINHLRAKEEELTAYRDQLEDMVKSRTAELVTANRKLQEEIRVREQSEQALRESEQKYRTLVDNANDAIFIIQNGQVTFPNPKACMLSNEIGVAIDKRPFFDFIHPSERREVLDWYRNRLQNNEVPSSCSFKLVNHNGHHCWVELNAVLIYWEKRIAALNFLRDITAQKNLEAQYRQAQRMESIGTLAGGIAHDFNNLLMGIQGNTSVMMIDIDAEHPLHEHLKSIERCVKSGANLTKQLLGFARGGKYVVKPTYLNEVMIRSSEIFGRTRKEINIHRRFRKDIWMVNVDVSQIEQVLLNLYVNAWQAMPNGGDLYLETDNVQLDPAYVAAKPYKIRPGRYVKISVTDTGIGMNREIQQRIFEPFFTTKEVGQGTGLGLASAYGIVKNHGGIINCYSEVGVGSTFNIYLPAHSTIGKRDDAAAEETYRGTETLMLVDDEKVIVEVGKRMLEGLGYTVLVADGGEAAVKLFAADPAGVDLVVLDMVMPYVGGSEVFDRIKAIRPDIRVLLSSGYSINGAAQEILSRGCNGFIQKPFNTAELSRKIREILDMANESC